MVEQAYVDYQLMQYRDAYHFMAKGLDGEGNAAVMRARRHMQEVKKLHGTEYATELNEIVLRIRREETPQERKSHGKD